MLAAEVENITSIRVNSLNPGRARTMMRRQAYPAEDLNSLPLPETLTGSLHCAARPGEPWSHRQNI